MVVRMPGARDREGPSEGAKERAGEMARGGWRETGGRRSEAEARRERENGGSAAWRCEVGTIGP